MGVAASSGGLPGRSPGYWNGQAGMWDTWPRQALHGVALNGMLGDARTPEPVVLVPVLGVVVVPVRGAQVLGRVVERPAAHHPPPGLSRLPWGYSATHCLACQAPLQVFLPAPELAPDVVGQSQREVPLAFRQPGRFMVGQYLPR